MLPFLAVFFVAPSSMLAGEKAAVANRDLAVLDDKDLYLAKGNGRKLQRLARDVGAFEWSPDGRTIAYQSGDKLYLQELTDGKRTKLPLDAGGDLWLSFDPARRALIVGGLDGKLTRVSIDPRYFGKSAQFLTQRDSMNQAVAWSPDGRTLAFTRDGDVWVAHRHAPRQDQPYYDEANRLAALAVYNDVEQGLSAATPFWVDGLRWTRDGKRLVFHFQRQGGTGVSQIGWIALQRVTPRGWSDASGFRTTVHWLSLKSDAMAFRPDVTPGGRSLSATVYEGGTPWLELISWDGTHRVKLMKNVDAALWRPEIGK